MKLGSTRPSFEPHPRAVGVEDADDPGLDAVVAVIGHGDGLGEPLGLVVAAAGADRVDVAPVVFALGVDLGVAVDLGRARQQEPGILGLGQPQGVVRAQRADLERGDRVSQVIDGAGRAGEMEDVDRRGRRSRSARRRCARRTGIGGRSSRALRCCGGCPVSRLSTQITSWPSPRNRSQRCEPMNPAPPVMTVLNERLLT